VLYDGRFAGFNSHPRLEGTHAFLSPSSPAWLRYDQERLIERLSTAQAAALGTELHETAARNIKRRIKLLPHDEWPALDLYVNDAIEHGMIPEQTLFYTVNCYGTADTIGFEEYIDAATGPFDGFLRIHDLKTGTSKASMDQLYVYAGIFCREYGYKPFRIDGELRIYQGDQVFAEMIDRTYLSFVYDRIKWSDDVIEGFRSGGQF
jgi:hypothetical protein